MKLYISGPMRGYPNFNFPLFDHAQRLLEAAGHTCYNPAEHDRETYPDIEEWEGFASGDTGKCPQFNLPTSLAWDFASILKADGIVLLPGWERSSGAKAERFVAEAVGKTVFEIRMDGQRRMRWWLDVTEAPRMAYPQLKEVA